LSLALSEDVAEVKVDLNQKLIIGNLVDKIGLSRTTRSNVFYGLTLDVQQYD
jgi:hypothetical protein